MLNIFDVINCIMKIIGVGCKSGGIDCVGRGIINDIEWVVGGFWYDVCDCF